MLRSKTEKQEDEFIDYRYILHHLSQFRNVFEGLGVKREFLGVMVGENVMAQHDLEQADYINKLEMPKKGFNPYK